jgi:hypothetical protein
MDNEELETARFRELLEETLLPPTNSVDLVRTPQSQYKLRLGATAPYVAELFHENTKLTPYQPARTMGTSELAEARRLSQTVPYRIREEDLVPEREHLLRVRHSALDPPLRSLLAPFAEPGEACRLLYSVDLMLVHRGMLLRQIPQTELLWVEKHVSAGELATIRASIVGISHPDLQRAANFLFLVGAPWRYMMFLGQRGYRHMLFDAGSLVERLRRTAAPHGVDLPVCLDFYDVRIDGILLLDGVERSTLGIVPMPYAASTAAIDAVQPMAKGDAGS